MGNSTISMAIFNSYVSLPEGSHDHMSIVGYSMLECIHVYPTLVMINQVWYLVILYHYYSWDTAITNYDMEYWDILGVYHQNWMI